jgi:hypothetical protein
VSAEVLGKKEAAKAGGKKGLGACESASRKDQGYIIRHITLMKICIFAI